ncbi:MAG: ABC transporter permease [Chloroflexi bacterium]|nr:ABC transporter permease [Chloroflexota bacterium]
MTTAHTAPVVTSARRNEAAARVQRRERLQLIGLRVAVLLVLGGVWEYFGARASPLQFAPLSLIAQSFGVALGSGELWHYLSLSLQTMLIGAVIGISSGLGLGLVMARFRLVDLALDTYITVLFSLPMIAIAPLIQRWLNSGELTGIVIVILFTFFPMVVNTYQGVKNVDGRLMEVARSFRTNEWQLWRDVVLPGALPFIAAGLRIAIPRALLAMVVADLYATASGVGRMIAVYTNRYQPEMVFVPVLTLAFLGVTLVTLSNWLERWLVPWAHARKEG